MITKRSVVFLPVVLLLFAPGAGAQEVGTVAVAQGTAEIGRAGAATPAEVGMPVMRGDELRTGSPGQLRVVFQDDSVLNLADDTRIVVDEQVFAPEQGRFWSTVRMLQGKVRAAVSNYYRQPGAAYELETPTAVAGVRGTMFAVAYDTSTQTTEVVGIDGYVEVRSLADRLKEGVYVAPSESTTVIRGGAPTPPQFLEENIFRQRLQGVDFSALRGVGSPLGTSLRTTSVPTQEHAPVASNDVFEHTLRGYRDPGEAIGQPPSVLSARGRLGVPF